MSELNEKKNKRIIFPGISSKNWEHPADTATMAVLKQVPQLNEALKKLLGFANDKSIRLLYLASSVRVTETQFPEIYKMHKEACSILDTPYVPELYIAQTPVLNAGAVGVNTPFVVLTSSIVRTFDNDELMSVIGHELGHCFSGHAFFRTLYMIIQRLLVQGVAQIGGMNIAYGVLMAIMAALHEWFRKSELSADRAGLLVVQDPEVCYRAEMKLAGGEMIDQMDINEFFKQAHEYESGGDLMDGVYKLMNLLYVTHPFPVLRLTELKTWVDSGDYGKILNGDYIRRDREDDKGEVNTHFKKASDKFKEDINKTEDPLGKAAKQVMDNFNNAADQLGNLFNNMFNNKKD